MYHHTLLTCAVVVMLNAFGDSNGGVVIEDTFTEAQDIHFLLQEEEPPANRTSPYVTETVLRNNVKDTNNAIGSASIRNGTQSNLEKPNPLFEQLSNSSMINQSDSQRKYNDNVYGMAQKNSHHIGYFESRNNMGAKKTEEKLIIIYANSSNSVHHENEHFFNNAPLSNSTNENKRENYEQPQESKEENTIINASNTDSEFGSNLETADLTGLNYEEYSSEETPTINYNERFDKNIEDYLMAEDNNTDFYHDDSTSDINDYYNVWDRNDFDYYTQSFYNSTSEETNSEIYLTTTLAPPTASHFNNEEEFTTTTSITGLDDNGEYKMLPSTSALPFFDGTQPDEVKATLLSTSALNENETSVTKQLSSTDIGYSNQRDKGIPEESYYTFGSTSLIDDTENTTLEIVSEEAATTPFLSLTQPQEDIDLKHFPSPTQPYFSDDPLEEINFTKSIIEMLNNNNKPQPFAIHNSVKDIVHEPIKEFTKTYKIHRTLKHDKLRDLHNSKDSATGPELTFMSAITNMGENIALLYDLPQSESVRNEAQTEHNAHAYNQNMWTRGEQTEIQDYPNFSSNKFMERRHDEMSPIDEDLTSTTTSTPLLDSLDSRALRRKVDSMVLNEYQDSEKFGSTWVGLGEYFKNHRSDLNSDDYLYNMIERTNKEGSEDEKDSVEYDDEDEDADADTDEDEDENENEDEDDDIEGEDLYNGILKKMKHASLDADTIKIDKRRDDEPTSEIDNDDGNILKRGKVIRSSQIFGAKPKDIIRKLKGRKKSKKSKKSKVSGYIKNKVGQADTANFGMPTLNIGTRGDSSLMMNFYNLIEKIGQELGQDVSGGYGLVGSRIAYDGVPGLIFLPKGTFAVRTKESTNRRSHREQIIPIPVPQPVSFPVPQPVPVRILQPLAVTIPVPVPVQRTVTVPVEKKVPVPVEKPVVVEIIKQIHVPVIKPYPVPVPIYKTQYIIHDRNE